MSKPYIRFPHLAFARFVVSTPPFLDLSSAITANQNREGSHMPIGKVWPLPKAVQIDNLISRFGLDSVLIPIMLSAIMAVANGIVHVADAHGSTLL